MLLSSYFTIQKEDRKMSESEKPAKIFLSGGDGRMGKIVKQVAEGDDRVVVMHSYDLFDMCNALIHKSPTLAGISRKISESNVLLMFHDDPDSVLPQTEAAFKLNIPVVIGTTGLNAECLAGLMRFSTKIPIIQANNFSLGIALLQSVVRKVAYVLPPEFQIEIVEKHHKNKLDSPSGTAIMLGETVCGSRKLDPKTSIECGRSGRSDSIRSDDVVGIQVVRGGSVAGEHEVGFYGPSENLLFSHQALSPEVFVQGALTACRWIVGKRPGMYTMAQVLGLE